MLVLSVTSTRNTSQPGCKQMPLQGNHPSQLKSQTTRDSYSAQPPKKRAHIIFVAAGRKYCHADRCHSQHSLPVAASPLPLSEIVIAWGLT